MHASAVALDGRGVLICGPSASGKSSLALELIALGADLIADDQVVIAQHGATLLASPPPDIAGLIEARGIGLLKRAWVSDVPLALMIDLDLDETERLPAIRHRTILDTPLPCLHEVMTGSWPAAVNIGPNPTFDDPQPKGEAHLIDCHESLYGKPLELDFLERLRDVRRFDDRQALVDQIEADVAAVRAAAGAE